MQCIRSCFSEISKTTVTKRLSVCDGCCHLKGLGFAKLALESTFLKYLKGSYKGYIKEEEKEAMETDFS